MRLYSMVIRVYNLCIRQCYYVHRSYNVGLCVTLNSLPLRLALNDRIGDTIRLLVNIEEAKLAIDLLSLSDILQSPIQDRVDDRKCLFRICLCSIDLCILIIRGGGEETSRSQERCVYC